MYCNLFKWEVDFHNKEWAAVYVGYGLFVNKEIFLRIMIPISLYRS
jgi:hypothetical protein